MQPSNPTEGQGHDVLSPEAWRELGSKPPCLWLPAPKVAKAAQGQEPISGGVVSAVAS